MNSTNAFDWDAFRPISQEMDRKLPPEVAACFRQYLEGNDCFDDCNSLEINGFLEVFKAGWIIAGLNHESPYIVTMRTVTLTERRYNPNYGDDRTWRWGYCISRCSRIRV